MRFFFVFLFFHFVPLGERPTDQSTNRSTDLTTNRPTDCPPHRRGIEKLLRKAKQDKEEAAEISGEGGDSKTNTAAGAMATPKAKGPVDAKKEN